jgi:hypothetical protein
MATPSIASRATDAPLDLAPRPDNTSCCCILVKTALTVAVVAAAAIAISVTLTCASPLVGLVVLFVSLPLAGIFLSATWAGTTRYVSYPAPRAYVPLYTRAPSPVFYGSTRRPLFPEPATASGFGPPAGAAFADRPVEFGYRARGPVLPFPSRPASFAAPRTPVGGGFGGVVHPMGPRAAAPDADHVGVGSGRRR